jgi:hypothetical protein
MILLDQVAGSTHASPERNQQTPEGSATVIILERDGSLHHYPPKRPQPGPRQAHIQLSQEQAQPNLLDRILDLTFDVLGVSTLEMRINEHPKR